ncbi:MAG: hypothetical protein ACT4PL_08540 [Phycisphaerales bacterium]
MHLLIVPLPMWTLVLAAGLAIVLWGMRPLRGSDERRCPNCWYDLGLVAGSRCPECAARGIVVDDLYPVRRAWGVILTGALLGTLPVWAMAQGAFESPLGNAILRDDGWVVRVLALGLGVAGGWLGQRALRGLMPPRRGRRLPSHGRWFMLAVAAVLVLNAWVVFRTPDARKGGWRRVFPDRIVTAVQRVADSIGK